MFISGEKYTPGHSRFIEVCNPATGELIETVLSAAPEDVEKAISSCNAAFNSWSKKSYAERSAVLSQISAALKEKTNLEKLAVTLTKEQGKPLSESRREIEGVIGVIDYFTGLSSSIHTDFYENHNNSSYSFTIKKPLGVCASILPWNMPALILSWKLIPALLTGNTCLVKPASACPLTILEMAAIFYESGLPAGAFNVVIGPGEEIGKQIAASPVIHKISFTGSTEAGQILNEMAAASKTNKRVTLELGGSDAMIICDDVDVRDCAVKAVQTKFFNCGQACISPKRIFVFESVFDEFIKYTLETVSQIRVGNGLSEGITMGPLSSAAGRKQMAEYAESARLEGAQIRAGGKIPTGIADDSEFKSGFFFEPTVITNVPKNSRLLKEEVFGPIMIINPVKDLDEAILEANNTNFGLGASIWTNDIRRAKRGVEELEAGIVWVNQHTKVLPELPFGGVKDSGFGRENGYAVLNDYLETKTAVFKF
ncbi:aldehyde dehydrogenase family protein [Methanimicrococcus sp. OttesenSCG-928-J09]|nr:aldehyde dehydrogenase family protein [Methanimicrococcus sp. OttesenSCG-928-J09]